MNTPRCSCINRRENLLPGSVAWKQKTMLVLKSHPLTPYVLVGAGQLPKFSLLLYNNTVLRYSIGMKVQSAFALSLWKSCLISMKLLRFGMDAAAERGENFSWHTDPKHRSRQQLVLFVTNWPASVAAHLFERAVASSILFSFSFFFLLAALRIGMGSRAKNVNFI